MTVNVELLQETLQYIKDHPKEWDQSLWAKKNSCGTSFCFAGTACRLSGERFNWKSGFQFFGVVDTETLVGGRGIPERAQELLGVTLNQRVDLFDGDNTLGELEEIVTDICKDAIADEHVMVFDKANEELEQWEEVLGRDA